jgi:hypothetical protein
VVVSAEVPRFCQSGLALTVADVSQRRSLALTGPPCASDRCCDPHIAYKQSELTGTTEYERGDPMFSTSEEYVSAGGERDGRRDIVLVDFEFEGITVTS